MIVRRRLRNESVMALVASKRMTLTSSHGRTAQVQVIYRRLAAFFNSLKTAAPQLSPQRCWGLILAKAMEAFSTATTGKQIKLLPMPA